MPEVVTGNMLTATVVGLNAWVEYEFRVVARNAVGLGEPSPSSAKTRTEDTSMRTTHAHTHRLTLLKWFWYQGFTKKKIIIIIAQFDVTFSQLIPHV